MAIGVSRHGSVRLTADGAVGASGEPVFVYGFSFVSGAGGAGVVVLRNGTTDSSPIYISDEGTASKGKTVNLGEGFFFPDGCFFDKDANVDHVVISYDLVRIG